MIERVARAIHAKARWQDGGINLVEAAEAWNDLSPGEKADWHYQARDAIGAMREPTEAMIAAAAQEEQPLMDFVRGWTAAIDAALKVE